MLPISLAAALPTLELSTLSDRLRIRGSVGNHTPRKECAPLPGSPSRLHILIFVVQLKPIDELERALHTYVRVEVLELAILFLTEALELRRVFLRQGILEL